MAKPALNREFRMLARSEPLFTLHTVEGRLGCIAAGTLAGESLWRAEPLPKP